MVARAVRESVREGRDEDQGEAMKRLPRLRITGRDIYPYGFVGARVDVIERTRHPASPERRGHSNAQHLAAANRRPAVGLRLARRERCPDKPDGIEVGLRDPEPTRHRVENIAGEVVAEGLQAADGPTSFYQWLSVEPHAKAVRWRTVEPDLDVDSTIRIERARVKGDALVENLSRGRGRDGRGRPIQDRGTRSPGRCDGESSQRDSDSCGDEDQHTPRRSPLSGTPPWPARFGSLNGRGATPENVVPVRGHTGDRLQPLKRLRDVRLDVDHGATSWNERRSAACAAPSVGDTVPTSTSSAVAIDL